MSKTIQQSGTSGSVTSIASSETSSNKSDEVLTNPINGNSIRRSSAASLPSKKESSRKEDRPPWRPAVAAGGPLLPKSDKKALLQAKLLEASRRALVRTRMVAMATQTDPPRAKLCKEVCVDSSDLVTMVDSGILTDGNVVLKDSNNGKLVMTHSVSQMTDPTKNIDCGTQTALPVAPISLDRYLKNAVTETNPASDKGYTDLLLKQIEELIQMNDDDESDLRRIPPTKKKSNKTIDLESDSESDSPVSADSLCRTSPIPEFTKKKATSNTDGFYLHHKEPATQSFWNNIDFSDDEDNFPQLPRRMTGNDGDGTLQDFRNILIGQRLSNMRLSPIPPRIRRPNRKIVTWTDTQHKAVSKLISEANALQQMFDKVSMLLGPDIKVHDVPDPGTDEEYELPPSKWDAMLTESCDRLEEKLNTFTQLSLEELHRFDKNGVGSG